MMINALLKYPKFHEIPHVCCFAFISLRCKPIVLVSNVHTELPTWHHHSGPVAETIRKTVLMIPIITAMQLQQQGINYDQILQRFSGHWYRYVPFKVITCRYTPWYLDQHQWQFTENQCVQQLFVNQPRKRGLRYSSDGNAWRLSPILKVWLLPYLALLCIVPVPKGKQQI